MKREMNIIKETKWGRYSIPKYTEQDFDKDVEIFNEMDTNGLTKCFYFNTALGWDPYQIESEWPEDINWNEVYQDLAEHGIYV